MIGEHGDSCVPVWSSASVSGVLLKDAVRVPHAPRHADVYVFDLHGVQFPLLGQSLDPDEWHQIGKAVVQSAYEGARVDG
jgi:hypothetical protein